MVHRLAAYGLIFSAVCMLGCASGPRLGSQARPFTAVDSDGRAVGSDSSGKISVLYFWATWCAPCVVSGPALQRVHERYARDDRVRVLGIHYDTRGNPVEYSVEHGYTFTLVPDGRDIVGAYNIKKIPSIVIIAPDGSVVYKKTGFGEGDELEIVNTIETYR